MSPNDRAAGDMLSASVVASSSPRLSVVVVSFLAERNGHDYSGKLKLNVLPEPMPAVTQICPPCRSTISFEM